MDNLGTMDKIAMYSGSTVSLARRVIELETQSDEYGQDVGNFNVEIGKALERALYQVTIGEEDGYSIFPGAFIEKIGELQSISEGRRMALNEKAEEARQNWIAKENAESKLEESEQKRLESAVMWNGEHLRLQQELAAEEQLRVETELENKRLCYSLLDMVMQHCQWSEGVFSDLALSANEYAIDLLMDLGLMEKIRPDKNWVRLTEKGQTAYST